MPLCHVVWLHTQSPSLFILYEENWEILWKLFSLYIENNREKGMGNFYWAGPHNQGSATPRAAWKGPLPDRVLGSILIICLPTGATWKQPSRPQIAALTGRSNPDSLLPWSILNFWPESEYLQNSVMFRIVLLNSELSGQWKYYVPYTCRICCPNSVHFDGQNSSTLVSIEVETWQLLPFCVMKEQP